MSLIIQVFGYLYLDLLSTTFFESILKLNGQQPLGFIRQTFHFHCSSKNHNSKHCITFKSSYLAEDTKLMHREQHSQKLVLQYLFSSSIFKNLVNESTKCVPDN